MNIGITGATGFIGRRIADLALRRGHEIIAYSRHPKQAIPGCEMRSYSVETAPDITGCDAFIHLAGEPVAGIWTRAKRDRIRQSRLLGTRRIAEAVQASDSPPEVVLCGSATGFYGDTGEAEITEDAPAGTGFLAEVAREWEGEALKITKSRVVLLRTSLVLGRKGGALGALEPLFRVGMGAVLGDGRQWMPWIHLEDEARLALFAVENLDISGPLNATAPWPVRNEAFTAALARAVHRPAFLRAPAFALRLLGEFSREVLDSKRIVPAAALEHGFRFHFPEVEDALRDLFP